jgi:hypothetical protein
VRRVPATQAAGTAGPSPLECGGDGPDRISLAELAAEFGVNQWRLRHWAARGWLHPVSEGRGLGRGSVFWWPPAELVVARRMAALVVSGFTPEAAAGIARQRRRTVRLAGGVLVILPHDRRGAL